MALYRVKFGDTPMSIASQFTGDPYEVSFLVSANPGKETISNNGILTFKYFFIDEIINIPSSWSISNNLGLGASPTDCDSIDFSKTAIPIAQQKIAIDACNKTKNDIKKYADSYMVNNGYTPEKAQQAAQAYQAYEAISQIYDFVTNSSSSLIMTQAEMRARATATFTSIATITAIGITVIAGTGVGIPIAAILAVIVGLTSWLGDALGFNDPAPVGQRLLFQNPCDPNSPDFATVWPKGVPGGPSDPRWIIDPKAHRQLHPDEGAGASVMLASPPFDVNKYKWLSGLNPNGQFESTVFAVIVQNAINKVNCSLAINDVDIFEAAVQAWNKSRDIDNPEVIHRIITFTPPPEGPPNNFFPPSEGLVPIDPITQTFRNFQFDWRKANIDGKTHWLGNHSITILDGPPMPPPSVEIDYGSAFDNYKPINRIGPLTPKTTSTGSKIVTGTLITGAVAAASLGIYAYVTKQTFSDAAKHLYDVTRNKVFKGAKENPIHFLPPHETSTAIVPYVEPTNMVPYIEPTQIIRSSHNKNRRVSYRVDLNDDPYIETVRMLSDGSSIVYRNQRPIARFMPSHYQLAKIRSGHGSLLIYADQLLV